MARIAARWIDGAWLDPLDLHATYTGLAEAQAPSASPIVFVARSRRAHISIGASQSAGADLDLERCRARGLDVIQRPLGGGSVLVDPDQTVICILFSRAHSPGRPGAVFDTCLEPLAGLIRDQGIAAERVGSQDIWAQGRKILGSGAATLGSTVVFATSILRRFDAVLFTEAVQAPSSGFRTWLGAALSEGMTDWASQGHTPADDALLPALRESLESAFGWRLLDSAPTVEEREAIAEAREELVEAFVGGGPRHVRHGIKINQQRYLLEEGTGDTALRLLVHAGRVARVWAADTEANVALQGCVDEPLDRFRLEERLVSSGMPDAGASRLIDRILRITADVPLVYE